MIDCWNNRHCVKRVRIRSYSCPHFSRILPHSDWAFSGKMQTSMTPNTDSFYAVRCCVINIKTRRNEWTIEIQKKSKSSKRSLKSWKKDVFFLTHWMPVLPSSRNQSDDLQNKWIESDLYKGNFNGLSSL